MTSLDDYVARYTHVPKETTMINSCTQCDSKDEICAYNQTTLDHTNFSRTVVVPMKVHNYEMVIFFSPCRSPTTGSTATRVFYGTAGGLRRLGAALHNLFTVLTVSCVCFFQDGRQAGGHLLRDGRVQNGCGELPLPREAQEEGRRGEVVYRTVAATVALHCTTTQQRRPEGRHVPFLVETQKACC